MDPRLRSFPPAVPLAIVGALLGAGAMLLPWYSLDVAGLSHAMQQAFTHFGGEASTMTSVQLDQASQAAVDQMKGEAHSHLVGYNVFRPFGVGLHLLAAFGGGAAALKVLSGQTRGLDQKKAFAGAAAFVALRPVLALVREPGGQDLADGFARIGVTDLHLLNPGIGIWVALLGAACLAGAAALAHVGDASPAPEAAFVAEQTAGLGSGGAYVPAGAPTPYMPSGATPAAPLASHALASDAAAFATPSGAAYGVGVPAAAAAPGGAYVPQAPYGAPAPPHAAPAPYGAPAPVAAHAGALPYVAPTPGRPPAAPTGPHLAMPVVRDSVGAYGAGGPGRLDQTPAIPRPEDPYAPKHAVPSAAALTAHAAKDAAMRAAGHVPPAAQAPMPLPPPPASEPRGGSVAPPGFA